MNTQVTMTVKHREIKGKEKKELLEKYKKEIDRGGKNEKQ